jgi:hypothetical protein
MRTTLDKGRAACSVTQPVFSVRFRRLFILTWVLVLFPFTLLGYGSDGDTWYVAYAANLLFSTGVYTKSRSVGFPIYEFMVYPLTYAGKWYLSNLLSLAAGVVLALGVFRLSPRLNRARLFLISMMFLPIVTKNATSTIDFLPGLAAIFWAYVMLVEGRFKLAALIIGLACGLRPTLGLMILPALVFAVRDKKPPGLLVKMVLIAFVTGLLAYSPVLIRYGISIPWNPIPFPLKTRLLLAGHHFLTVLGVVQTLVLIGLVGVALAKAFRQRHPYLASGSFAFHLCAIVVWSALFLVAPDEPEYLLPLVPSALLLADALLSRRSFAAMAALLMLYHVAALGTVGGESGQRHFALSSKPGYTITDAMARIFRVSLRAAAAQYHPKQKTLIMLEVIPVVVQRDEWAQDRMICFTVLDKICSVTWKRRNGNLYLSSPILNIEQLRLLKEEGFRVVIWKHDKSQFEMWGNPEWRNYVEIINDLEEFFGTPIRGRSLTLR